MTTVFVKQPLAFLGSANKHYSLNNTSQWFQNQIEHKYTKLKLKANWEYGLP